MTTQDDHSVSDSLAPLDTHLRRYKLASEKWIACLNETGEEVSSIMSVLPPHRYEQLREVLLRWHHATSEVAEAADDLRNDIVRELTTNQATLDKIVQESKEIVEMWERMKNDK